MCAADLAGPDRARAAAHQAGRAGVVVGRRERRPGQHPVARLERPREGVDRGELERLGVGQVGEQAGDPFGDAGLARPLGAGQQQVVTTRGGHLDGVAGVLHARQVGEVDLLHPLVTAPGQQPGAGHRGHRWPLRHRLVAELGDHLRQRAHAHHLQPGHHRRLANLRLRHHDVASSSLGRRHRHRQHPGHRPQAAGEGELADEDDALERGAGHHAGGSEDGDRDRQVVVGAALGQVGRREQDRRTAGGRPLELAVDDRHPAAVARLVEGGVGPADQHGGHLAGRDVGLDVDEVADGAVERHRVRGRERHSGQPLDVIDDRRAASWPEHGDQVDAHLLGPHVVLLGPSPHEPVQPLEPDRVDRLVR